MTWNRREKRRHFSSAILSRSAADTRNRKYLSAHTPPRPNPTTPEISYDNSSRENFRRNSKLQFRIYPNTLSHQDSNKPTVYSG